MKAIVLVSGGLDSTTCLAIARDRGYDCYALSFDYGQRSVSELAAAKRVARTFSVKDHKIVSLGMDALGGSALTDLNIRIFIDDSHIYAFNADLFVVDTDIEAIFDQLGIDDAGHAFYLGQELTKARLALQLGKNYRQDQPLNWGYLSAPDEAAGQRHVQLTTQRRRQGKDETT